MIQEEPSKMLTTCDLCSSVNSSGNSTKKVHGLPGFAHQRDGDVASGESLHQRDLYCYLQVVPFSSKQ
ncbi:hypothetical protein LINGRAPRIM_LOCUS2745, partial [Linum grandiflorum]